MNYPSPSRLYRHAKQMHDAKEFKCQYKKCVESFDTKAKLDNHFAQSHTRNECPHCKKMILVSYMAQHMKDRHDENHRVICDICGKVSTSVYAHSSHYQTLHVVQEKIQCAICGDW